MSKNLILKIPSLMLFGEGGEGGSSASGGGTGTEGATGVPAGVPDQHKGSKNPLADVKYGIQPETPASAPAKEEATPDRDAAFDALVKGEYKDIYDARVQSTIQQRLKASHETVEKYKALAPTLDLLAQRYGVDPSDQDALIKAIEEDDSYYEQEAMEKGVEVSQLKAIRKMERENAELKRKMQETQLKERSEQIMAGWMQQADALKQIYPQFNLQAELSNKQFADLLRANIDVRSAFEVVHKDEIISGAMQFAVKKAEQKLTNKIISGGRPAENGTSGQSSPTVKSDVSQLTKADRAEIARRVAAGERISFG